MKHTKNIGIGVLTLLLGLGTLVGTASAYNSDPTVKGPNYTPERHTAMQEAFETNDYNAWKNLMGNKGRVTTVINKDNFAQFAEAHKLAEKGDLAGAQRIRKELGLGLQNGQGIKNGNHAGRGMNRNNNFTR